MLHKLLRESLLTTLILLCACTPVGQPVAAPVIPATGIPTSGAVSDARPTPPLSTAGASKLVDKPTNTPSPAQQSLNTELDWETLPITPVISPEMQEVFKRGQESGREAGRFSKIGDCQNINTYFLAMFDSGNYRLGEDYAYLQPTIDQFAGSWSRQSLAVKGGMNVAAVLSPMWANPELCRSKETPLACELRINNPAFAIISLEEAWSGSIDNYDFYLREIVAYVLSQEVVPIIATRAETEAQERRINPVVAQIAADYKVPLWNFGVAARRLPNNGIRPDGFHLTEGRAYFDDPEMLKTGWTQRNLTALQSIDVVYRGVAGEP